MVAGGLAAPLGGYHISLEEGVIKRGVFRAGGFTSPGFTNHIFISVCTLADPKRGEVSIWSYEKYLQRVRGFS